MIIEIALGIVLAVIILALAPYILAAGIIAAVVAVAVALLALVWFATDQSHQVIAESLAYLAISTFILAVIYKGIILGNL